MVQTRSQVKDNPLASPPMSLSKIPKKNKANRRPEDDDQPLTPLSPNTVDGATHQLKGFNLKQHSERHPASFPVYRGVEPCSDSEDEAAEQAFTIPVSRTSMDNNNIMHTANEPEVKAISKDDSTESLQLPTEAINTTTETAPPPARKYVRSFVKFSFKANNVFLNICINIFTNIAKTLQVRPEDKLLKRLPDKPIECTKLPDGPEPVAIEIEYPTRDALVPLENTETAIPLMLENLASTAWVDTCYGLMHLRQLTVHNPELCEPLLEQIVPLVIKSVRNLRSAVCKTAVMAAADLFLTFKDTILPLCDVGGMAKPLTSLLCQLFLKGASNDKKFVIEEALRALNVRFGFVFGFVFLKFIHDFIY